MWEVRHRDDKWQLCNDDKPLMVSPKLCRVMREFKKAKSRDEEVENVDK